MYILGIALVQMAFGATKSERALPKMCGVADSLGAILASLCALLIDRSSSHGYMSGLIILMISCINLINLYHYKPEKIKVKNDKVISLPHTLMTDEEILKLPLIPRETRLVWLTVVTNFTLNGLWSFSLTIYLYNVMHPYTVVTGAFGLVALLQTLNFFEESEYCYFSSLVLSAIGCLAMLINESIRNGYIGILIITAGTIGLKGQVSSHIQKCLGKDCSKNKLEWSEAVGSLSGALFAILLRD